MTFAAPINETALADRRVFHHIVIRSRVLRYNGQTHNHTVATVLRCVRLLVVARTIDRQAAPLYGRTNQQLTRLGQLSQRRYMYIVHENHTILGIWSSRDSVTPCCVIGYFDRTVVERQGVSVTQGEIFIPDNVANRSVTHSYCRRYQQHAAQRSI